MSKLHVILASTRPGRAGAGIADWFVGFARDHGSFDVELIDLAKVDLPLLDEAGHPRLGSYENAHSKAWSALVDEADAFVFVTPEYNYATPPALVNALDYLHREWQYKPVGFVSYGGVSGGLRGVQMTKQIVTTLKMMPIPEAVVVPFFAKQIDEAGQFIGTPEQEQGARAMLDELLRWAEALQPLRAVQQTS